MNSLGYVSVDKLIEFANNHVAGIDANDIARFPKADVEEVKHGKWKDGHCTNCGTSKFVVKIVRGFDEVLYEYEGEANYCPNCGAKMDKGQEE